MSLFWRPDLTNTLAPSCDYFCCSHCFKLSGVEPSVAPKAQHQSGHGMQVYASHVQSENSERTLLHKEPKASKRSRVKEEQQCSDYEDGQTNAVDVVRNRTLHVSTRAIMLPLYRMSVRKHAGWVTLCRFVTWRGQRSRRKGAQRFKGKAQMMECLQMACLQLWKHRCYQELERKILQLRHEWLSNWPKPEAAESSTHREMTVLGTTYLTRQSVLVLAVN